MTYVDRITETEFDARIREIEEDLFNIHLDALGIEVAYCTHPEDVDEEIGRVRDLAIDKLSDRQLEEISYWDASAYHARDRFRATAELRRRRERTRAATQTILDRWAMGLTRDDFGNWRKA